MSAALPGVWTWLCIIICYHSAFFGYSLSIFGVLQLCQTTVVTRQSKYPTSSTVMTMLVFFGRKPNYRQLKTYNQPLIWKQFNKLAKSLPYFFHLVNLHSFILWKIRIRKYVCHTKIPPWCFFFTLANKCLFTLAHRHFTFYCFFFISGEDISF
jgi:hypothetical protein